MDDLDLNGTDKPSPRKAKTEKQYVTWQSLLLTLGGSLGFVITLLQTQFDTYKTNQNRHFEAATDRIEGELDQLRADQRSIIRVINEKTDISLDSKMLVSDDTDTTE